MTKPWSFVGRLLIPAFATPLTDGADLTILQCALRPGRVLGVATS